MRDVRKRTEELAMTNPPVKPQCPLDDDGKPDHDWQLVKDWYGDPDVVNGTADCSFRRCRVCGEEDRETPVTAKDWADEHDEDRA